MPVEDITESMHDRQGTKWLSVYDGRDFYRVKCEDNSFEFMTVYDYNNNLVRDDEVSDLMKEEATNWLNLQTNG